MIFPDLRVLSRAQHVSFGVFWFSMSPTFGLKSPNGTSKLDSGCNMLPEESDNAFSFHLELHLSELSFSCVLATIW